MRLADTVTRRKTHRYTRLCISFQIYFLYLIFKAAVKSHHDETLLQVKQKNRQHLLWGSVTPHYYHSAALGTATATSPPPWECKQDQICVNKIKDLGSICLSFWTWWSLNSGEDCGKKRWRYCESKRPLPWWLQKWKQNPNYGLCVLKTQGTNSKRGQEVALK